MKRPKITFGDKLIVTAREAAIMLSISRPTFNARRLDADDPLSDIPSMPDRPLKFHVDDIRAVAQAYRDAGLKFQIEGGG